MANWNVTINILGTPTDITSLIDVRSIDRDKRLFSELKPNVNRCDFRAQFTQALWAQLVGAAEISVAITKDGSAYFTGVISPNYTTDIIDGRKFISFIAEDYSLSKLGKTIAAVTVYPGYAVCTPEATATSLLHAIATAAGVTLAGSLPTISAVVPYACVLPDDKMTWGSLLAGILFNYKYVYYFNDDGTMTIIPSINSGTITTTNSFTVAPGTGNVREKVTPKKSPNKYDDIRIKYNTVELQNGLVLLEDTSGAGNGNSCNITLEASGDANGKDYYPPNCATNEVFSEWKNPEGKKIWVATSAALDVTLGANIALSRAFSNYYRRASFAYHNSSGAQRNITKLRITGNAYIITAQAVARSSAAGGKTLLEYEAKYLFTEGLGQALANALAQYYSFSDFTYSLKSQSDFAVGEYVQLTDSTYSGISQKCRIIGKRDRSNTKSIEYTLEAVADFASITVSTDSTATSPPTSSPATAAAQATASGAAASVAAVVAITGTPTPTPAAPVAVFSVYKRTLTIDIQPQSSLQGFVRYEAQISRDNANWYAPNYLAALDTDGWYSGALNADYDFSAASLTLGFLPIPLDASGNPLAAGQVYYLRVRTVAGSASGWTTSPALTVKATLFADIASAQLQLSNVNLQKYIKARDPSAPVDGLVAWYSFDDMPAVPDGAAGTTYLSNWTAGLNGWSANYGCTISWANGKLLAPGNGTGPKISFYTPNYQCNGLRVRMVFNYDADLQALTYWNGVTEIQVWPQLVGNKYIVDFVATIPSYVGLVFYFTYGSSAIAGTKTVIVDTVYLGDGSYAAGWPRDNSGNGNHGLEARTAIPCDGVNNKGVFLGTPTNGQIRLPVILNPSGKITMSAWVCISVSTGAYQIILSRDDATHYIGITPAGYLTFQWYNGSAQVGISAPDLFPFSATVWHHVAATHNGTTGKIYIDGILVAQGNAGYVDRSTCYSPYRIGAWGNTGYPLIGFVDEVRLYSRDLASEEIAYLYQNPGGPQAGTVYADQIYAGAITAKLAEISNLDVDQHASIIRINSNVIYNGPTALSGSAATAAGYTIAELYLIPAPSIYAGLYAVNYSDYTTGRSRSGNATNYIYCDGSGNEKISGQLNAATGTFAGVLSAATGSFSGTIDGGVLNVYSGDKNTPVNGDAKLSILSATIKAYIYSGGSWLLKNTISVSADYTSFTQAIDVPTIFIGVANIGSIRAHNTLNGNYSEADIYDYIKAAISANGSQIQIHGMIAGIASRVCVSHAAIVSGTQIALFGIEAGNGVINNVVINKGSVVSHNCSLSW